MSPLHKSSKPAFSPPFSLHLVPPTASRCVSVTITSPVSRNKYDALTLFAYNVGCDFFKKTAVVKAVNRREPDSAVVKAFADYIWTDGKVCRCSPTVAGTGRCTPFVSCLSTVHCFSCFSCSLALLHSCSLTHLLSCLLSYSLRLELTLCFVRHKTSTPISHPLPLSQQIYQTSVEMRAYEASLYRTTAFCFNEN